MAKTPARRARGIPHHRAVDDLQIPGEEAEKPGFVAGFRAFKAGVAMAENPFGPDDAAHADFDRGWRHGNAWRVADGYPD